MLEIAEIFVCQAKFKGDFLLIRSQARGPPEEGHRLLWTIGVGQEMPEKEQGLRPRWPVRCGFAVKAFGFLKPASQPRRARGLDQLADLGSGLLWFLSFGHE